jgi:hypothetical protein
MVRHHVLIGLGFKRQNFRNRALKYMIDKNIIGSGLRTMKPAVMPSTFIRPQTGSGPLAVARIPLKFNY